MVPAPAGTAAVKTIFKSEDGILLCYGTTAPDALAGYAQGCIFYDINGEAGATLYVNEGDDTTSDFNVVLAEDNILAAIQTHLATQLATKAYGVEAAYPLATAAAGVGPSPLIWDESKLLDVMLDPTKGYYYFNDFLCFNPVTAEGITIAQSGTSGTVAMDPTVEGGILDIDTEGSTAADGPTVLFAGMQIKPQAGTKIYFECRVKCSVDDSRWYIGLADDAETDYVSDDSVDITKNQVGFFRDSSCNSTDDVSTISSKADAEDINDTVIEAMANDAYVTFGIVIDGLSTVEFYHQGALVETVSATANIPDGVICPIFQVNVDTGQAHIYVDWMRLLVYDADGSCRES